MVVLLLSRLVAWAALLLLLLLLHAHTTHAHTTRAHHAAHTTARTFTLGYLTGSERLPEDQEYKRPGLIISGAITLAVEEVSQILIQSFDTDELFRQW